MKRPAPSSRASLLHRLFPPLAAWFASRFSRFSPIQRQALPHTLTHENTLILAPTGSGKTLAAFLSVLSNLGWRAHAGPLPNAVLALYVSPLKALDNDIHRNLTLPLEAINAALPPSRRIRMEVRTGDTTPAHRAAQQRLRPHLLLTTAETFSALLSQSGWRDGFAPETVIVDEIHIFAESKRGSLLTLALERCETLAPRPLQRIGLSATAFPPDAVARFLCGLRPCFIAATNPLRAHRLTLDGPQNVSLPPAGHNPYRVAHFLAERVRQARCTLLFTVTRSSAERIGLALKVLLPDLEDQIAVHHSSVHRDERLRIEALLAAGRLRAVACSSSLELGVDYSTVDQVILTGAPHGVSSALQRLGRSHHRLGAPAEGLIVPVSLPDLMECIAVFHAARLGHLDPLQIPQAPLDVLAQALLGMSIERPWPIEDAFALVRRAGPYLNLSRDDFNATLHYLAGHGRVISEPAYGKILIENGSFRVASPKVARQYYLNTGAISDEFQITIMAGNRKLGAVNEGFLASLKPGEAFTIGGKAVKVKSLHHNVALVEAARGESVHVARWIGNKMPLSLRVAQEELRLRRRLREAFSQGGEAACASLLIHHWRVPPHLARAAAAFVARHHRAAPIPIDTPVQLERIQEGNTLTLLFHVLAGRPVNHALAWVLAWRLDPHGSVTSNFDDRAFFVSLSARRAPSLDQLRHAFDPHGWLDDLHRALASTDSLGRNFRPVAETGQLLPRRTLRGQTSARSATWNASLLYSTLQKYEPHHPLLRETLREFLTDKMDAPRAQQESRRIFSSPWEVFDHPRPSPFALPLYAAFNRETLLSPDPDRALDDLFEQLYARWEQA